MAVFASLAEKLQETFKKLKGKGKLNEADVNAAMREIRLALLEADVNFKVVKDFINRIKERAVGQEVMTSLTPGQQVVKIVHEEMTGLMGGTESKINWANQPPTVIMLVGLQGSGKTTTAAKLSNLLKNQGRRPLMVAADVYRPAAIKQLELMGEKIDVRVFGMGTGFKPVDIAKGGLEHAAKHGNNPVILDTAGRLHIDQVMMDELRQIKDNIHPHEILLVVDAMTGQDAVRVASTFHEQLGLTGIILTKLDGDTRGGAALSVKAVTGCPIKFVGMGEKTEALEIFRPDRMSSRILGMGDVLSLIEKAQEHMDIEQAKELQKKMRQQEYTLEDFLDQMKQMKKMGPLDEILGMLPGAGKMKQLKNIQIDPKEMVHMEAIIQSMTPEERRTPAIIGGSRKKRIAAGSGTRVQEVNRLLRQFEDAKKLIRLFSEGSGSKKRKSHNPFPFLH